MEKKLSQPAEMPVEILKPFPSPLHNRLAKVGTQINVPQNRFWFRRCRDGDCKRISSIRKPVSAPKSAPKNMPLKTSKGSK